MAMAKTWRNYECTFETSNTSNTLPDSRYFVTPAQMARAALVNEGPGRPPNQMVSGAPSICYVDPDSVLHQSIMGTHDDDAITLMAVVGDTIHVRVNGV